MTPEEQAKLDQATAALADHLPALWWRLYSNCVKCGFTPDQAIDLLHTYIETTCKTDYIPPQPPPPKDPNDDNDEPEFRGPQYH